MVLFLMYASDNGAFSFYVPINGAFFNYAPDNGKPAPHFIIYFC
jgi:hypothetical protein